MVVERRKIFWQKANKLISLAYWYIQWTYPTFSQWSVKQQHLFTCILTMKSTCLCCTKLTRVLTTWREVSQSTHDSSPPLNVTCCHLISRFPLNETTKRDSQFLVFWFVIYLRCSGSHAPSMTASNSLFHGTDLDEWCSNVFALVSVFSRSLTCVRCSILSHVVMFHTPRDVVYYFIAGKLNI